MKSKLSFMLLIVLCAAVITTGFVLVVAGREVDDCLDDYNYTLTAVERHDSFSWLDVITPESYEIVKTYLATALDKEYADWMVISYVLDVMGITVLRYYDNIPFEDMPDNPRRTLVKMMERYIIYNMMLSYEVHGYHRSKSSVEFGRNMID